MLSSRNGMFSTCRLCGIQNVIWGMILYTADSLAEVDGYDERNWGGNAYEYALTLCMDSVLAV